MSKDGRVLGEGVGGCMGWDGMVGMVVLDKGKAKASVVRLVAPGQRSV